MPFDQRAIMNEIKFRHYKLPKLVLSIRIFHGKQAAFDQLRSYLPFYFQDTFIFFIRTLSSIKRKGKSKAVPLQAWTGPKVSRKLRFPDFVTTAQDGGRLSALRTGRLYPQEMLLVLIYVRGWVDPWDIVRSEGFYINEKFHWHQLGSNQRPSDL